MTNLVVIGSNCLDTLIAETLEEQSKGLMFQKWPPPVMSFLYTTAEIRKFWMKNTISPLDIVFCCNGEVIGIFNGEPLSTVCVGPDEPTDLVVELPRGYAKKLGIDIGDEVKILRGSHALAKKFEKKLVGRA